MVVIVDGVAGVWCRERHLAVVTLTVRYGVDLGILVLKRVLPRERVAFLGGD